MKRAFTLVCLLTITTLLVVGCPAPTPVVVEKEKVVEKPVIQTVVVEKEVVVEKKVIETVEVEKVVEKVVTPTPVPVPEAKTIRVGVTIPLSAPGSVTGGHDMLAGFKIAAADINEAGGVLGKPIELIIGDTEGLPERGTAVAERLITEDKVVAIVGEYHSAVALNTMEVTHKYHIPTIFSETWSDKITAAGYEEVFRIAPASTLAARAQVDWLEAVGAKRVVVIAENTDFGIGMVEKLQKFLPDAGIEIIGEPLMVEMGTEDFMPILTRIQAIDPPPDAIITTPVTGETNYNLVRQMIDLGLAPTADTICLANQVAFNPEFWDNVPEGNYVAFTRVGLTRAGYNDIARKFADTFEAQFKRPPPGFALEAYDTLLILADAIKRAGTTDADAVIAALEETDMVGAQGRYYFPYGTKNPVPEGEPAWMWHQWPDPATLVLQYYEKGQSGEEAAVLWPPAHQTHGTLYIEPGTAP